MERSGERPGGVDRDRSSGPFVTPAVDSASISQDGRDSALAVERLAERARQGADRRDVIAEAKARLHGGQLDNDAVFREVARAVLAEG